MTQELYVARTKDNRVIVFTIDFSDENERQRKINDFSRSCQDRTLQEFLHDRNARLYDHIPEYDAVDVPNTGFLDNEYTGYKYVKDRGAYENRLQTNEVPPEMNQPNTAHFDYAINDNIIPEVIKNIGFKIVPVDLKYNVTYNSLTREYDIRDDAGGDFRHRVATVKHGINTLEVVRNHFTFAPEDYNRLTRLLNDFEQQKQQNPLLSMDTFISHLADARDNALMNAYNNAYLPTQEKEQTILHELKHVKNALFSAGLELKPDSKRMSVEDVYRLKKEDERSAYFNEWMDSINKYLRNGNFADYSMFNHGAKTVVDNLKRMQTDAEKTAYLTDYRRLMTDFAQFFEQNKQRNYEDQFQGNVDCAVQKMSLSAEPDLDRSEYRRLRSLYFRYEVYNPQTHRMEYKNLSEFMPEDEQLPQRVVDSIIRPGEEKLQQRFEQYNDLVNRGDINPSLLDVAKRVMREGIAGQSFVNEVDDIQISTFYGSDNMPPTGENTPPSGGNPPAGENTSPEEQNNPPTPPNDRTEWSDQLKQYWSAVDGYHEEAKNNNEYRFKIHDATISYENKRRVQISSNAPYDLYVKMLKEPTNANKPVKFLDSLTQEQALILYIACVNNGRQMKGNVPTDFSEIQNLQGVPPAAINRFRHLTQNNNSSSSRETTPLSPARPNLMKNILLQRGNSR